MYKIKIDNDIVKIEQKQWTAKELIELVGDEPSDCKLVSAEKKLIFNGVVDLEKYKKFQTWHPDHVPQSWRNVH